uniref:NIF system FeS cluster assembly NifU N-terminal domain-containing protein n=1 Tax=Chelydra serpentina TaxID=8475 RepID=A0A8C3SQE3_CHESE
MAVLVTDVLLDLIGNPINMGSFDKTGKNPTASNSLAMEWIKGKTVDKDLTIRNFDIAKELCCPPVKLFCSMLVVLWPLEQPEDAAVIPYLYMSSPLSSMKLRAT